MCNTPEDDLHVKSALIPHVFIVIDGVITAEYNNKLGQE